MRYEASRCKLSVVVPRFRSTDDEVVRELVTLQIRHVLQVFVTARAYVSRDVQIQELVAFLFRNFMVAVTLANGGCFLQLIVE